MNDFKTATGGVIIMNEKRASIRFIERCYKLYEQKMYHVAYCILRDEGLAEDAVQEAFIDIYNQKKREQELIFFSDENSDFDRSKPEALDEQQQQIREVMDKLPAKYYSVVNCMVVKELSVKETAKELSISEDNVRKRFERAKLLLKTIMKGCGGYEESRAV